MARTANDPNEIATDPADGVRRFHDLNIQAAVESVLATVPADKRVAVVAHATLLGAALTAMVRLSGRWSVLAAAYKPYRGPLAAEAQLRFVA